MKVPQIFKVSKNWMQVGIGAEPLKFLYIWCFSVFFLGSVACSRAETGDSVGTKRHIGELQRSKLLGDCHRIDIENI